MKKISYLKLFATFLFFAILSSGPSPAPECFVGPEPGSCYNPADPTLDCGAMGGGGCAPAWTCCLPPPI